MTLGGAVYLAFALGALYILIDHYNYIAKQTLKRLEQQPTTQTSDVGSQQSNADKTEVFVARELVHVSPENQVTK